MLVALKCAECGGKVDRSTLTCKYCGTEYYDNSKEKGLVAVNSAAAYTTTNPNIISYRFLERDNENHILFGR